MIFDTKKVFILCLCLLCEVDSTAKKTAKDRERRDTVKNPLRKWRNGIIPYIFGISAGIQTRSAFRAAIHEIQKVSCVRFVRRTTQRDYVRVITGDGYEKCPGEWVYNLKSWERNRYNLKSWERNRFNLTIANCYSIIGKDGGRQDLSLGDGCYRKGIAIHETMHLLGFFHEQSRLDRDEHVTVNYYNALETSKRQFKKYKPNEGDTLGEKYDPDSIMHYSNKAFSKNGGATLTYVKDAKKKLGQRDHLSEIDIRQLNKMYRCSKILANETSTQKSGNKTLSKVELDKCRDNPWSSFSGQCTFYSFMGSCFHSPQRMAYLCPKTCGYCRPTCIDTSVYCNFFSYYGYCLNNNVVRKRCRKTCGLCRTV